MKAIEIKKARELQSIPDPAEFSFGKFFTDHMFVANFDAQKGWHSPRIIPFGDLQISPVASSLQYGQTLFEGMKAFRGVDKKVRIFRPEFHQKRLCAGADRLCMPGVPLDLFLEGIRALLRTDEAWVSADPRASLYLRPTLIATEAFLGMRPAETYQLLIPASPASLPPGEKPPLKIWVELEQSRASVGGLGAVKASANYGASLLATTRARAEGCDQVLWLDSATKTIIEEVGTMNVFFRIGDEFITPPLEGTILAGVTRDSVIRILRSWGLRVTERKLTVTELFESQHQLSEAFGTGTAATVSSIGEFRVGPRLLQLAPAVDSVASRLKAQLRAISRAEVVDGFGWMSEVLP